MDTQTRLSDTAPLVALVQSVARLELEAGWIGAPPTESPEAIAENRFLAARDGMRAELVRTAASRRVPLTVELERLLELSEPHATELGCAPELADVRRLAVAGGSARQRAHARSNGVADLPRALAEAFTDPGPAPVPPGDAEPSGRPARAVPA
jgi:carboxylate-amine ligase